MVMVCGTSCAQWRESLVDTLKHDTLRLHPLATAAATKICHIWVIFSQFSLAVVKSAVDTTPIVLVIEQLADMCGVTY